jgi:hypothetical protein
MKKLAICLLLTATMYAQTTLERCQQKQCYGYTAPSGAAQPGLTYIDLSQTPAAFYCGSSSGWSSCGATGSVYTPSAVAITGGTVNGITSFSLGTAADAAIAAKVASVALTGTFGYGLSVAIPSGASNNYAAALGNLRFSKSTFPELIETTNGNPIVLGNSLNCYANDQCALGTTGVHYLNVVGTNYFGNATAPTGVCPTQGAWQFTQDGHATFCPSNGGTWTTKI